MVSIPFKVTQEKENNYNLILRQSDNTTYDLIAITVPDGKGGEIDINIEFTDNDTFDLYITCDNYDLINQGNPTGSSWCQNNLT